MDDRLIAIPLEPAELRRSESSALHRVRKHLDADTRACFSAHRSWLRGLLTDMMHVPSIRPEIAEIYPDREPETWSADETPFLLAHADGE